MKAIGKGVVEEQLGTIPVKLTGVLLVPKLKENVRSTEAASRNGAVFTFACKKFLPLWASRYVATKGPRVGAALRVTLLNSSFLLRI